MENVDKRNRFDEEVFSYRATKDSKVFLYWYGKQVKILKGQAAQEFLEDIADLDRERRNWSWLELLETLNAETNARDNNSLLCLSVRKRRYYRDASQSL